MYQPELSTLYKNMLYFSPNDIIQLIDSLEAALGLSQIYAPAVAQKTYEFAKAQYLASGTGHVSNQYYEDGTPLPKGQGAEGGPAVYAYIARVGDRLGDTSFARRLITEQLGPGQMYLAGGPKDDGNWFFAWSSALLAIREYQEVPLQVGPPAPSASDQQPAAPSSQPPSAAPATPTPTPASAGLPSVYGVQPGDSLTAVAKKFGVSVVDLAAANGLSPTAKLLIGQTLHLPADAVAPTPEPTP